MALIEYRDIATSLLRYSADVAERLKQKYNFDLTAVDFDAYADNAKLPSGDLVGWTQWEINQESQQVGFYLVGGIGFSVVNDTNLTRLNMYYIDEILQDINAKCPPIPIFKGNQNVALKVGEFAFSGGFDITDVGVEGSRSYKFLTVTLLSEQRLKYHRV